MIDDLTRTVTNRSPMLATRADLTQIKYPVLGSTKFDGVRCLGMNRRAMSRAMLALPNQSLQKWFGHYAAVLDGLDGELIVGDPTSPDCYVKTVSQIMTAGGDPAFTYYVFDKWDAPLPYNQRLELLHAIQLPGVSVVPQRVIVDQAQLLAFEAQVVALGYEGVMVRSMFSLYKWGVSTIQEGGLLKIKRFHDAEAVIVGYTEELCNNNEPTLSETGRTKRSTHRVNKVGKNRLGAWIVTGLTAFPGITFRVGTGLTTKQRIDFWLQRETDIGKIIKFNYFTVGAKNAPRNPVYAGFRDRIDM